MRGESAISPVAPSAYVIFMTIARRKAVLVLVKRATKFYDVCMIVLVLS